MSGLSWYVVRGVNPVPWTAPSVSVGRKRGGGFYPRVYSSAELKNYKEAIRAEVEHAYPDAPVIEDGIALRFFFWRHIDTGTKGGKKKVHGMEADATNLQKSTEDALQGVLFKNDKQVIRAESWIMGQSDTTDPLVVICIERNPRRPQIEVESGIDLFGEEYTQVNNTVAEDHIDKPEELF